MRVGVLDDPGLGLIAMGRTHVVLVELPIGAAARITWIEMEASHVPGNSVS